MASSTAEALQQARALQPDVILVDIGLGDESGFDLARLLAREGQDGSAKVILISTRDEAGYTELIADSPAAGFLAKLELSARGIGRILGDGAGASSAMAGWAHPARPLGLRGRGRPAYPFSPPLVPARSCDLPS